MLVNLLNDISRLDIMRKNISLLYCEIEGRPRFRDIMDDLKLFMACLDVNGEVNNTNVGEYYDKLYGKIKILNDKCYDINTLDSVMFRNTLLLWTVFNSCVYSAIFLVENRKLFNPKLDINLTEKGNELTALQAAILKGRVRCNNDNCNDKINMGVLIDLLVDCDDIDCYKVNKYGYNAFDLALSVYDYETVVHVRTRFPDIVVRKDIIDKRYSVFNINNFFEEDIIPGPSYYRNKDIENNLRINYDKIILFLNL